MGISRIIIIVAVIVVIAIIGFYAFTLLATSKTTESSSWLSSASYPLQADGVYGVSLGQCVSSTSNIYCFGGTDVNTLPRNNTYGSSAISSTSPNITSWAAGNPYPLTVNSQACVTSSGYVYCVGGSYDENEDDTASSYYASLNSGTPGVWNATTAFPIPLDTAACVASSSYIYCIGGYNETGGSASNSTLSNSVWYAPLSSTGIGAWKDTTAYPPVAFLVSCAASNGYVYCVGGLDSSNNPVDNVYYASLSSTGVGPWTGTSRTQLQCQLNHASRRRVTFIASAGRNLTVRIPIRFTMLPRRAPALEAGSRLAFIRTASQVLASLHLVTYTASVERIIVSTPKLRMFTILHSALFLANQKCFVRSWAGKC